MNVSNPNGVNLHFSFHCLPFITFSVSNPNGVNLHYSKGSEFRLRKGVSNPNGVNLHLISYFGLFAEKRFQTPTG